MADDLTAPLGKTPKDKFTDVSIGGFSRVPYAQISFSLIALIIFVSLGWVLITDDPNGGHPYVLTKIRNAQIDNSVAENVGNDDISANPELVVDPSIDQGSEPEIVGDSTIPERVTDTIGANPNLLEESQHGAIPRIGTDGARPSDVYARASSGGDGVQPRIAILVSGLGLSADGSKQAIDILPDDITLGFAPYGRTVAKIARDARIGGHEIMLQIPLEPFDYPQNDPGPQTLLTGQSQRVNLDRLYWLMAQIEAYTGIVNYMGGRFTASTSDFTPVMEEIAVRGLSYLDDGASARSVAGVLANANSVPFGQASIQIDAMPLRATILQELRKLEELAKKNGSAIGVASALPVSVRTLAEWASQLEKRGIILVPVSTLTQSN